jgi:adenosylhomocysteine nucleosidase
MTVRIRSWKTAAVAAGILALTGSAAFASSAGALASAGAQKGARARAGANARTETAPVGIVSADPEEQAPILAAMHVTRHVTIAGPRNWPRGFSTPPSTRALFSGTAGAQNAGINVGDVVLSGHVVDKSQIHYQLGGYQSAYSGIELHAVKGSDSAGAIIDSYGNAYPTPADAGNFDNENDPTDKSWIFVNALAATKELVTVAEHAPTGTETVADATGNSKAAGTFANKVVVGTIGQANVWSEPLSWIEAQNMLFQTDAEENEGSGFAFANAAAGVPWMLVGGISDTPWYPNAYDADLAADRAGAVVKYLVDRLPARVSKAPVTMSTLSPLANARQAGYLVAGQAYFDVTPVTKVVYTNARGKTTTLTGGALSRLTKEYTYGAAGL